MPSNYRRVFILPFGLALSSGCPYGRIGIDFVLFPPPVYAGGFICTFKERKTNIMEKKQIQKKIFEFKDLQGFDKLVFSSNGMIDFYKEHSEVKIYYNGNVNADKQFYPDKYIGETGQRNTTAFEIPIKCNYASLAFFAYTGFDIELVKIHPAVQTLINLHET